MKRTVTSVLFVSLLILGLGFRGSFGPDDTGIVSTVQAATSTCSLRGCPETKSLKNNILCHVLGKTKNGITGSAVSCHAFSKV
jgi:hypothetical protein